MENEKNPELFWLNTIRNDLQRHNQVLTSFCSILVYYINEMDETYDVIFADPLIRKSLHELTLSVYSLNPKATDNDVVANIRLVLANYLDDYDKFEKFLISQIPEVKSQDLLWYNVTHSEYSSNSKNT